MTPQVLVVDDNNMSRMMLSRAVREQGHRVEVAPDGKSALDTLRNGVFDLVLLDVLMPEMDGYQVLEAMMADPALRHIPVIMVSALEEMDSVIRCIELGAQDYLPKPVNSLLLRARINASLVKKHLHDVEMQYLQQIEREKRRADDLLNVVIPIGVSLSEEREFGRLLERILKEAMSFSGAAGGVLYLRTETSELQVVTAHYEGLPGSAAVTRLALAAAPLPLDAPPSARAELAVAVASTDCVVNVPDAYAQTAYDFTAIHQRDAAAGYRSISFLAMPLRSGDGQVNGVVQLINACDPPSERVIPFDKHLEQMMASLSTLAGVALGHYQREQRLQEEIAGLRIEIDERRAAREVAELTETEFFRQLEAKTDRLRKRLG